MYHERSSGDWGLGGVLTICAVVCLIGAFAFVKAVSLIIHTLIAYPKQRILWVFLAVFVGSLVVGLLFGYWFRNAAFLSLGAVGFGALTLVSYIVSLRNSQTLLKEPDMVKSVLGSSWWGDDTKQTAA